MTLTPKVLIADCSARKPTWVMAPCSAIGTPMTYDFYRSEMHGLSPVGSPTYVPPESTFDKSSGESFVCSVCGYVYSDPNFSFEELPDNWVCPVCKMPKKAFVRRN